MIVLICFGVGMLIGNFFNGKLIEVYATEAGTNWDTIWMITTVICVVLLGAFLVLFRDDVRKTAEVSTTETAEQNDSGAGD